MANGINIAQLARRCQVSQATVSRVFSGAAQVKPETRERILTAARELHYAPQQTARKDNIAIIIPATQAIEPPSWFAGMLATVLMREIYRAGYVARLYEAGDMELIQPNFTKAAVVFHWSPKESEYERLISLDRPVIALNTEDLPFAHSVCTDHAQGVKMAMAHLIARGHRRIGLLSLPDHNWGNRERLRAYRESFANVGFAYHPDLVHHGDVEGQLTPEGIERMLNAGATALLCAHEDWTLQLQHYLLGMGKKIPDDISIISAEIPGLSKWLNPPHTSLFQAPIALADMVIDMIQEMPTRSKIPIALKHQRLAYQLIERNSVKSIS